MTTISITTDAAADPATVTEYGDALPELVRALNHVTRHHEAMDYPADADRLVRNVSRAVGRLPQLLGQVSARLNDMYADGQIQMTGGEFPQAAVAVMAAEARLEKASSLAVQLQEVLDSAASVTADMAGTEPGEDDDGG